ncbi:MAG: phosphoribosylanthranilate isomerase [Ignavibacteria bacterium]|jgi:phosphoribosylanthranilate isomerase|nr:phosphoribosylanthranilate isomerase [Ignavibacteria bacterium]MCU7505149.1 phosphoribosylanthranilate isomerase [Ignavibacteria bacterium]MCU7517998.1 phosphoribosylanthranilate isomerase [Ignavibacteria bacterium]
MKVKVCGITNVPDAMLCETLGADMLGFIFYAKSKRFVEFSAAEEIIGKLRPETRKVGVFVNETAGYVNKAAKRLCLSAVQLHGDESPEEASKITFPVIKSFRIKTGFDFSLLNSFKNATPLLDSFAGSQFGGTGTSFDWHIIPDDIKGSIILAGGISAANIGCIYKSIKPYAVDLSSSLESEPGKKDRNKVQEFFDVLNYNRTKQSLEVE